MPDSVEMRFLSVCSGIEAASVAWKPLGWEAAAFAEIEAFPSAVLAHHYPGIPNMGDMTRFKEWDLEPGSVDLLVGGTPCQSFSIAGLRGGLDDDRGNLALVFARMVDHFRPRWVVWENVPGVLSSHGGRDFGAILGAFHELGYSCAWRILDAQYFGVPQRRRRVFLVASARDWRGPAAVLFERQSVRGNTQASREKGKGYPGTAADGPENECAGCGVMWEPDGALEACPVCGSMLRVYIPNLSPCLETTMNDYSRADGFTAIIPPVTVHGTQDPIALVDRAFPLGRNSGQENAVLFAENSRGEVRLEDGDGSVSGALSSGGGKPGQGFPAIAGSLGVRRLTPTECERLQGFPDGYTQVPYRGKEAADSPRYKALGNSMAVPVMRWIGERLAKVERLS